MLNTTGKLKVGEIVKGTILAVSGNDVLVDIGYKAVGSVPVSDFKDQEVKVGDTCDVLVLNLETRSGMVDISKAKADEKLRWEALLKKYTEGCTLNGLVTGKVRGGLTIEVDGITAFLPGSQIDIEAIHDMDQYVGQTLELKLLKISHERRNLILSRRELLEERLAEQKRELLASIQIGQHRTGKVKNITDFGAFIDLAGLDGLLHITDMSWGRVKHPSEILKVGDELEVVVLDVDLERERVSLGLKQIQKNPWEGIEEKYPIGAKVHGKVVNQAPYGAFVELEPGIEGLMHISEFSWTKRVAKASDILKVGDEVDVAILSINTVDQKIALGIRQTEENPWDTVQKRYPIGSRVKGKVRNFTSYGAFVEIEDGIDGMIHVSDMSWTRKINHPSEMLQKGQEVEAVVLEIDIEQQRISLGLKQASEDPWSSIASRYSIGQIVKGKVSKIASFGAFIELEDGVDGLVHISQISNDHVEKVKDALKVGQEVEARIVRVDGGDRRIGLSIKAVDMSDDEVEALTKEIGAEEATIKPGENMVGLASAFDEAFAQSEEWTPSEK
ncbi:MAG: 30S ribosomal protein S1 [Kiritimatiellae bacterium]|nr:30S ribosomal protein S1 [Kiritimatiellia bacterium]